MSEVLTTPPGSGAGSAWPVAVVDSWAEDLLPWRHGTYDFEQRLGGLGPLWSWLGVLTIPMVVGLWRRRSAALAAIAPIFILFLIQPYRWWARFTLPLAAVGAIAIVVSGQWSRTGIGRRARSSPRGRARTGRGAARGGQGEPGFVGHTAADDACRRTRWGIDGRTQYRSPFFPEYRFLDSVPVYER